MKLVFIEYGGLALKVTNRVDTRTKVQEAKQGSEMTADQVKKLLGLVPHPQEGGCYVRTYEAAETIPAAAFADGRYNGPRRTGTAIYYLLEPEMRWRCSSCSRTDRAGE